MTRPLASLLVGLLGVAPAYQPVAPPGPRETVDMTKPNSDALLRGAVRRLYTDHIERADPAACARRAIVAYSVEVGMWTVEVVCVDAYWRPR